jgi:hypothetical protein
MDYYGMEHDGAEMSSLGVMMAFLLKEQRVESRDKSQKRRESKKAKSSKVSQAVSRFRSRAS